MICIRRRASLRKKHPWIWAGTLYGPVVITVALVILLLVFAGFSFTRKLATMAVVALVVLGRFVILSGRTVGLWTLRGKSHRFSCSHWSRNLDLMTALVLAFHIDFSSKFRTLGHAFQRW